VKQAWIVGAGDASGYLAEDSRSEIGVAVRGVCSSVVRFSVVSLGHVAAVWIGQVSAASCGRTGHRTDEVGDEPRRPGVDDIPRELAQRAAGCERGEAVYAGPAHDRRIAGVAGVEQPLGDETGERVLELPVRRSGTDDLGPDEGIRGHAAHGEEGDVEPPGLVECELEVPEADARQHRQPVGSPALVAVDGDGHLRQRGNGDRAKQRVVIREVPVRGPRGHSGSPGGLPKDDRVGTAAARHRQPRLKERFT